MEKKKLKAVDLVAFVVSVLPFLTLIPVFLKIVLPDGIRTVWSCVNMFCVVLGFILSAIGIKRSGGKSFINIVALIVSGFLLLLVAGVVVLAVLLMFLQ